MLSRLGVCICASLAALLPASLRAASPDPVPTTKQLEFFEAKIRPLLIEQCHKCHSAKSEKLKGGLHLDTREGLLKGGDSGPAVVPGDMETSRIIEAVRYADPDTAMPPKQKLPDAAIKDLEAWVKMGAPWPQEKAGSGAVAKKGPDYEKLVREFWSYQPIRLAKPQAAKDGTWARGEIDRYVLPPLEVKGLKPVADADRITLIRRVYLDLIGLPPTPEQIDAFVADRSPDAFEKVVDRLLASPQFGERWGRHWLDVARFAESLTLRGFVLKDAWRYRDYVIDQFNADRPFDQFLQEQVAGDLMPAENTEQRRRQMTGTTFLTLGNNNLEEQDKKQLRMDVVDEQLETLGKAFLAQTIGCARCHDHKFDPIPTKDYYALAGILRNAKTLEHSNVSKWMEVPLPPMDPAQESEVQKHEAAVAAMQAKIAQARSALAAAGKPGGKVSKGGILDVADLPGVVIDDETARKVGNWNASTSVKPYIGAGYLTDNGGQKGEMTVTFQPDLPHAGRYDVRLAYTGSKNRDKAVPVTVFSADGEKVVLVDMQRPPPVDGHFVSLGTYAFEKNGQGFVLVSNEDTTGHVVVDAVQFVPAEQVIAGDGAAASPKAQAGDDAAVKASADLISAEQLRKMEAELKKFQDSGPKRETVISVLEEKQIEDTQIHVRGNVHNLGPTVQRGFLSAVPVKNPPKVSAEQSGRRELGLWLAAKDNPLPARVMANRCWHWLVGQGIVRTVDNFGTTGETPSHPELLDYLAARLAGHNSVKKLVREIVLSRTYQLAYANDAKAAAADPENRLCWRANRERLDADALRDTMLVVSAQLDPTMGGMTYKAGMSSDYTFKHSDLRRSVYAPVFRNAMNEALEAFDAADSSMVTGKRNSSTVAPQALFMLNHPFVQEQAKAAAGRLLKDGPTDVVARAELAYRWTLGRLPSAGERQVVLKYVNGYASAAKDAEQDAWAQVFHGLFASIDFRYVE